MAYVFGPVSIRQGSSYGVALEFFHMTISNAIRTAKMIIAAQLKKFQEGSKFGKKLASITSAHASLKTFHLGKRRSREQHVKLGMAFGSSQ